MKRTRLAAYMVTTGLLVGFHTAAGSPGSPIYPPARETVLRIARSQDGLSFSDTGEILVAAAAAPDLTILPNGHIIALFDLASRGDNAARTVIGAARSTDGGRSWSPARPISFSSGRNRYINARHGDLVLERSGRLRLFFSADLGREKRGSRRRIGDATIVGSAISANGLKYVIDRRTLIRPNGGDDVHPVVVRFGSRLHLFSGAAHHSASTRNAVHHFVSRNGRRFARLAPARVAGGAFVGSVVTVDRRLRAYISTTRGIESFLSGNGRSWSAEPGTRMSQGWDPAVTRLADGAYLMAYCAPRTDATSAVTPLVDSSMAAIESDAVDWPDVSDDWVALGDEVDTTEAGSDSTKTTPDTDGTVAVVNESFDQPGTGLEDWDPLTSGGFAPLPDFKTKIDYFQWYSEFALGHPEDNAYDYYTQFMPGLNDIPGSKPDWPTEFHDMFDDQYEGPPIPWDGESRPKWEETYQAVQGLLDRFREASMHAGYASSAQTSIGTSDDDLPDGDRLLIGILLPSLSPHRRMVKSTLASAWRKVDGKVSSERMLDAWRTSLRAAAHVQQGATLIEDLVGTAERAQVQKTARWALKRDVFSADELETALETLREFDRPALDPDKYMRLEHAFAMDMTQWMFTPPTAAGQPKLNIKRVDALAKEDWFGGGAIENYADMGPEVAYASLDAFDRHYRELGDQMRVGYPDVRAADIEAALHQYLDASPITKMFLPSLSRYYQLRTRLETSRRATQLAYATHLFKAQNGRWPESLDALPSDVVYDIRTDPFSGQDFGYRLTEDGPTIYSLSENGVDDGGIHSPRWGDKITNDAGSDDHVFWPPQR